MSDARPAAPTPSSTVILLREETGAAGPFSVLLLERHGGIAFPGAHAFPGGIVEPEDANVEGARLPEGQRWAAADEGDAPPEALTYWVTAVRELFEEIGILLARRDGRPLAGALPPEVAALRERLLAGEPFGRLLSAAGLVVATDVLRYFARWITPVVNPRRWDTRFLVGRVPARQIASVDGTETVSFVWLSPRAALAEYEAGRLVLIPPTVCTLDDLARFPTVDAVLENASRRIVRAVVPEVVQAGGETAIHYPANTGDTSTPARRLVLRDGRWRPASG